MSTELKSVQSLESILPTLVGDLDELEKLMLSTEQGEAPVRHIFGPGMYIREVTLPKGAWVLGNHQNFDQMNIMISGSVVMYNQDGTTRTLTAPMTFVGPPGRKLGYVIEDCIWQNVYATTETDVEKLEAYYITKTEASELEKKERFELEEVFHEPDRVDFDKMVEEIGVSKEEIERQSHDMSDAIDLPMANYKFQTGNSPIQGKGVFATTFIHAGEVIGPARLDGKRTILGRGINHSPNPNCVMVNSGTDLWITAIEDIKGQVGSQLGDELTLDYRQARRINIIINTQKELLCLQQ